MSDEDSLIRHTPSLFMAVFVVLFLLAILVLTDYVVSKSRLASRFIHSSTLAMFLGLIVGGIVYAVDHREVCTSAAAVARRAAHSASRLRPRSLTHTHTRRSRPRTVQALKFDPDIFFLYLLPPIIYDTAYKMKRGAFFKNIGLTMALAWGGTLFSTFAIGTVVYVAGRSGSIFAISFVECTVFGALISATDPVSVIAVFEKKRVNRNLNAVVVGESVLNDAVSITLVRVLLDYMEEDATPTAGGFVVTVLTFVGVFAAAVALGVAVGLLSALLHKHVDVYRELGIEALLAVVFPYMSYFLAEGIHLSGIVSMLFCGMVMAHYTFNNLSIKAQVLTREFFHIYASIAELSIFIWLGIAVFAYELVFDWPLIFLTITLMLVARGLHVVPFALGANFFRTRAAKKKNRQANNLVTANQLMVLWLAGLRGAVAFALAASLRTPAANRILSTTLVIVFLSVVIIGSSFESLLLALKVPMGNAVIQADQADERETAAAKQAGHGVHGWDKRVLKPFFTTGAKFRGSANPYADFAPPRATLATAETDDVELVLNDANEIGPENPSRSSSETATTPDRASNSE